MNRYEDGGRAYLGGGGGRVNRYSDGWEGCTDEDFDAMREGYYGA